MESSSSNDKRQARLILMVKMDSSSNSKDNDSNNEVNPSYNEFVDKHKKILGEFENLLIN